MTRRLIGIEEVAAKLNRSPAWLYKNYKKKIAEENFPRPVKRLGCSWDCLEIEIWYEKHLTRGNSNDNQPRNRYWEDLLRQKAAIL